MAKDDKDKIPKKIVKKQDVQKLDKKKIKDVFKREGQPKPLIGIDLPNDFYKGKPLKEAGADICPLQHWIRDNSEFEVNVLVGMSGVTTGYRVEFREKATGEIIHAEEGEVTGKDIPDIDVAQTIRRRIHLAIIEVAKWIEEETVAE